MRPCLPVMAVDGGPETALGEASSALRVNGTVHAAPAGTETPLPWILQRNGADDAAMDTALIAMSLPDRPVLVQWTRTDEHL